jgi:hypothetical protein
MSSTIPGLCWSKAKVTISLRDKPRLMGMIGRVMSVHMAEHTLNNFAVLVAVFSFVRVYRRQFEMAGGLRLRPQVRTVRCRANAGRRQQAKHNRDYDKNPAQCSQFPCKSI